MDGAVVTGLFALGGVIVGGVLNNLLAYRLEKRREGWDGKSKARLFAPVMMRLSMAMGAALDERWTWQELCVVVESNLDDFWNKFAPPFAGTFADDEWMTVYLAVRPLEQMTHTSPRDDGTRVSQDDSDYLSGLIDSATEAAMVLMMVGSRGPNRRSVGDVFRRLRYRFRPPDEDKLLAEAGFSQEEIASLKESDAS